MESQKDEQQNAPTSKEQCQWCGKELPEVVYTEEFLTGVFGYVYCSEECIRKHVESK